MRKVVDRDLGLAYVGREVVESLSAAYIRLRRQGESLRSDRRIIGICSGVREGIQY